MGYNSTVATATNQYGAPIKQPPLAVENGVKPTQQAAPQKQGVKGGLVIFWLVAGICMGKDVLDILTSLLDLIGLGLQVIPVIGNAAGIAIGGLSLGIDFIASLTVDFIIATYFSYIGGSFGRRLVVISIGAIIELIPGLDILPMTTIMFFLAYFIGKINIIKTVASFNPAARKIYAVASKL